jgi:hypothetical protein
VTNGWKNGETTSLLKLLISAKNIRFKPKRFWSPTKEKCLALPEMYKFIRMFVAHPKKNTLSGKWSIKQPYFHFDKQNIAKIQPTTQNILKYHQRRWGSSLMGLRTLDPLLVPPLTLAVFFRCTCPRGGG